MPTNRMWASQIQYPWWSNAIAIFWGYSIWWQVYKKATLPDQFHEDMQDAISCYCMGGEL